MQALTRFRTPFAGLVAAAAFFVAGCDSDKAPSPPTEDSLQQTEDINDPYGGFNRSSEPVAFGDATLAVEGETGVHDAIVEEPETSTLLGRPETVLYAVRITWGYIGQDSTKNNEDAVDWSGSAVVDTGAVLAVRTIRFEDVQGDHIVRPRDSREKLEWVSTTTSSFDGVQLLVIDPQLEGVAPNTFSVTMPLVAKTYDVTALDGLNETTQVDELGHQFQIQARKVAITPDCRAGWMSGRWGPVANDQTDLPDGVLGRFAGHWVNTRGDLGGTLRGFYGVNTRGNRVLFGKIIDDQGNFVGLLRGTWDIGVSPGVGTYRAHWLDFDRDVVGGMRGVWERRGRNVGGFFMGAWATLCDPDQGGEVVIDTGIF